MCADLLDYSVKYFRSRVAIVFDGFMKSVDFGDMYSDEYGMTTYLKKNLFFHVGYYPETSPNYELQISTGFSRNSHRDYEKSIGLWRVLPKDSPFLKESGLWLFSNETELEKRLIQIRDNAVKVYLMPLWENPDRLLSLIEAQNEELKAAEGLERVAVKREQAANALKARNYLEAIEIYNQIKSTDLSESDKKKLEIARKLLEKSHKQ